MTTFSQHFSSEKLRLPTVRHNVNTGRLMYEGWNGGKVEIDVTADPILMDLTTLKVGWRAYSSTGPIDVLVNPGEEFPAQPTKVVTNSRGDAKWRAVLTLVCCVDGIDGDCEFTTSDSATATAIEALYEQFGPSDCPAKFAGTDAVPMFVPIVDSSPEIVKPVPEVKKRDFFDDLESLRTPSKAVAAPQQNHKESAGVILARIRATQAANKSAEGVA